MIRPYRVSHRFTTYNHLASFALCAPLSLERKWPSSWRTQSYSCPSAHRSFDTAFFSIKQVNIRVISFNGFEDDFIKTQQWASRGCIKHYECLWVKRYPTFFTGALPLCFASATVGSDYWWALMSPFRLANTHFVFVKLVSSGPSAKSVILDGESNNHWSSSIEFALELTWLSFWIFTI